MVKCAPPLNPLDVWAPSPGMKSCVDCGSPCCGEFTTQEECEETYNDDWFGMSREFWIVLITIAVVLFFLGSTGLYFLMRYSPAGAVNAPRSLS